MTNHPPPDDNPSPNERNSPSTGPSSDRSDSIDRPHRVRNLIRRVRRSHEPNSEPILSNHAEIETPNELNQDTPGLTNQLESLPKSLGRFEIKRQLGRGGFGLVVLARDPQLDRWVALKVPKLDALFSAQGRQRFLREARAAALLGHPHIVSVYEAGQSGPMLYIAFEWIDGQSLSEYLSTQPHPLPTEIAIELMLQLAAAVQHAHQRGILHRDLKPANILLQRPAADLSQEPWAWLQHAKIADFGLARIQPCASPTALANELPSDPDSPTNETATGDMLGTPRYAAPESLRVRSNEMGPAVDVYGLGAILYELLTGQPPFTGDSLANIVYAVEHNRPVQPHRIRPAVSRDLEAICLKCLEKEAGRRYATAAELEDDLQRLKSGRPILARHWTRWEQSLYWLQRNRIVATWAAIAFLSLTIGLVIAIFQAKRMESLFRDSEKHRIAAQNNLTEAQNQRKRAERLLGHSQQTIEEMLANVADQLESIPQMEALRHRLLESALEQEIQIAAEAPQDESSQLRVAIARSRIIDINYDLGNIEQAQQAIDQFNEAWPQLCEMAQSTLPELRALWAKIQLRQASYSAQKKSLADQHQWHQEVLQKLAIWSGEHPHPDLTRMQAVASTKQALVLRNQGKNDEALQFYDQAVAFLDLIPPESLRPADHLDRITTLSQTGNVYSNLGQTQKAIDTWLAVAALEEKIPADFPHMLSWSSNRAITHFNLGTAYRDLRDYPHAEIYMSKAIEQFLVLSQQFPWHPTHQQHLVTLQLGLGALYQTQGKYELAMECLETGIEAGEQYNQRFSPTNNVLANLSTLYGNQANLLFYQKQQPEAAEVAWQKSVAAIEALLERQPQNDTYQPKLAAALGNIAMYKLATNQIEDAQALIARGLAAIEPIYAKQPQVPSVRSAYRAQLTNSAICHCLLNRVDDAIQQAEKMAQIDSQNSQSWVQAATVLGRCYQAVSNNAHDRFPMDQSDRQRLLEKYAAQCREWLTRAEELGAENLDALLRQPEFVGITLD